MAVLVLQCHAADFDSDEVFFPLELIFAQKGEPWNLSPDQFATKYKRLGFSWVSRTRKDVLNLFDGPVVFLEDPVFETIVRFRNKKVHEVVLSLYNRGDSGDVTEEEFEDTIKALSAQITSWTGVRATKIKGVLNTAGTTKEGLVWTRRPNQFKAEWSSTKASRKKGHGYRAEYIRFSAQLFNSSSDYRSSIIAKKTSRGGTVSASKLKSNVRTLKNGDVFINGIPMVDQGPKGYCVVATTERIMRYYGREIDQHELAQMANTHTTKGTRASDMINALRKLGVALGCKVKVCHVWTWSTFNKRVKNYNKLAKKEGAFEIVVPEMGTINIGDINKAMNTDIFRKVRAAEKTDYKKFIRDITRNVKRGMPLVWSVTTGRVVEDPPVLQIGGHMRMIIGYNTKTSEILYSDSWGAGYEMNRMSAEDAWMITDAMYLVEPSRLTI